jgi:hypothetical protein
MSFQGNKIAVPAADKIIAECGSSSRVPAFSDHEKRERERERRSRDKRIKEDKGKARTIAGA